MQHDAWFFVGVLAFIFLIWIATGGPTHPIAFSGPTLAEPQELGGGTYLSFPRAPFKLGGNEVHLAGSSNGNATNNNYSITRTSSFLKGVSFGSPSPYRNLISVSHYISGAGSANPNKESLQISVSRNSKTPVDITGWTLKSSATGKSSTIPKGSKILTSGIVNSVSDIVLLPGERVILISGRSPIGGSFRENKCIGYFSQFQKFSPTLPQNCPTPSSELSSSFGSGYIRDASCIDYVNTLSRCQAVLSPPVTISGKCQSFLIKHLNYNGCVSEHKNDSDFLGDTWRVYLGRTTPMWRTKNEVVKLLDTQGKTVDAFSY